MKRCIILTIGLAIVREPLQFAWRCRGYSNFKATHPECFVAHAAWLSIHAIIEEETHAHN